MALVSMALGLENVASKAFVDAKVSIVVEG